MRLDLVKQFSSRLGKHREGKSRCRGSGHPPKNRTRTQGGVTVGVGEEANVNQACADPLGGRIGLWTHW